MNYLLVDRAPVPGRVLRRALQDAGGVPVRALGAVNAIAAQVATEAGFGALWVSGLEASAALGLPDANVIGVRDLADVVAAVGRATALPVIVDVDNAGGSVLTAGRYAADLVRAGAAALCLEDSAYPKCNSFSLHARQGLADPEVVWDQLAEMRRAAGPDLVLIARTEALIAGAGLPAALERVGSYVAAGADAVVVHSKDPTGNEALQAAHAWRGRSAPLAVIPTAFAHLGWQELGHAGFSLCIYANQLSRAALAVMRATAEEIARTGSVTSTVLPPVGELLRIGQPDARACI